MHSATAHTSLFSPRALYSVFTIGLVFLTVCVFGVMTFMISFGLFDISRTDLPVFFSASEPLGIA